MVGIQKAIFLGLFLVCLASVAMARNLERLSGRGIDADEARMFLRELAEGAFARRGCAATRYTCDQGTPCCTGKCDIHETYGNTYWGYCQ